MPKPKPKPVSPLLSYMRLFRLPNVFTAVADVMMGFLVVRGSFEPVAAFVCLVGASCLLYLAGMVLNDVYDLDVDARERPARPLPAGEISPVWAKWLGYELLLLGVALGSLAGYAQWDGIAIPWRSGAVVSLLAACVVGYDIGLKATALGPAVMGACRMLNVLLGMSLAPAVAAGGPALLLGFHWPQIVLAAGLGVYVAGVTWYARTEAKESNQRQLAAGTGVMVLGIALFGTFPMLGPMGGSDTQMDARWWWLLLAMLGFTIVRRSLSAALNPSPSAVQVAVKQAILSLIVLDAAATLMVRGPQMALIVLVLLVPAIVLGRWVYST